MFLRFMINLAFIATFATTFLLGYDHKLGIAVSLISCPLSILVTYKWKTECDNFKKEQPVNVDV